MCAPLPFNRLVPAGSYSITAKATDGYGISNTGTAISVISNAPPTVSLTGPANKSVSTAPGTFALAANAADSDGSIAKVEFYNGAALLGTATAAPYTYTWSNVPAGTYSLTAKATDNLGATATSAAVSVTSNAAPKVSLTAPANNSSATAPAHITLGANASDPDGTVAKVEFFNGTTLLGTATAAPYSYIWNSAPVGTYSITAVATDNLGAQTTSAASAITVIAPPAVTLTSPANNAANIAPGSFALAANATSAGTITKVDFFNGTSLIGTATSAPYTFAWSNVPAGSYSLTAVATDGNGATATSAPVGVTVKVAAAQVYYIHTDHLDTPRVITDTAGTVVWQWDNSDPFGNNMPNENPSGLGTFGYNQRFAGQYFDKETGLHYNFHRDYDPAIGTYKQFDPIGLAGGINGYTYVMGNPLSRTDPKGLFPMYGCWGGENWSGCEWQSNIPSNPAPPKDAYDACAMQHDYCYAAAQSSQSSNSCPANPPPTIAACDLQLFYCTVAVPSGTGGLVGRVWGTVQGTWALLKAAGGK